MSVRLWTKWLCVRVQLQSLKLEISCLLRVRSSWHSGNYLVWIHSNAYMTWQEHTVNFYLFFKRPATWKIFVLKVFSCFYIFVIDFIFAFFVFMIYWQLNVVVYITLVLAAWIKQHFVCFMHIIIFVRKSWWIYFYICYKYITVFEATYK